MKRIIITISCLLMSLVLFACSNNNTNDVPVEMRVQDGYIQYNNGTGWTNLISTDELKGEKGDKGDKGDPGTDGKNGINGLNGKDGVDGVNGTNGANGKDGKDGTDGKDATITQDNITKEFHIKIKTEKGYGYLDEYYYYGGIVINSLTKTTVGEKTATSFDKTNIMDCTLLMNEDGKAEIEAKAPEGWCFEKWSDGSTDPKRTITYNDDVNLYAYFSYDKEPLDQAYDLDFAVDSETKDFIITWNEVKNAKDYTIYIDDKLTLTSNTNYISIPANKLEKDSEYDIAIIANPTDTSKYIFSSYRRQNVKYYGDYEIDLSVVPGFEQGVTAPVDYEKALKDAGFQGQTHYKFHEEGATKENNATIYEVSPEPGSKLMSEKYVTVTVYSYKGLMLNYGIDNNGIICVLSNLELANWIVEGASNYKYVKEEKTFYITPSAGENNIIVKAKANDEKGTTDKIEIKVDGDSGDKDTTDQETAKVFKVGVNRSKINPYSYSDYGGIVINSLTNATVTVTNTSSYDQTYMKSCSISMNKGGEIEIEAKAAKDWYFVNWSDGSTDPKRTITYNDTLDLTANFSFDKEPIETPGIDLFQVDYKTKDFILPLKQVENAKDYTVVLDGKLTYTSDGNFIRIPSSDLEKDKSYSVTITANPIDENKYMSSMVYHPQIEYTEQCVGKVPDFTPGVTTLADYESSLKDAGLEVEKTYDVTDGATTDNNGKVSAVGINVYVENSVNIFVYKYDASTSSE